METHFCQISSTVTAKFPVLQPCNPETINILTFCDKFSNPLDFYHEIMPKLHMAKNNENNKYRPHII